MTKRERNASFPLEIPYRLVNMYSVKGDTVLDPFCGMGTTNLACMISERNSVGTDVSGEIIELALENLEAQAETVNEVIDGRIEAHRRFISGLSDEKREKCYKNVPHGFSVKTRQETAIRLRHLSSLERNGNESSILGRFVRKRPIDAVGSQSSSSISMTSPLFVFS